MIYKIGTKVRITQECLEWGSKNVDAYIRHGDGSIFDISDADIMSIMLKSMFPDEIESVIIGYGLTDENASKKLNKKVNYIKVQHFIDKVPFNQEYLSIFDICQSSILRFD